jgi:hypothetical protein
MWFWLNTHTMHRMVSFWDKDLLFATTYQRHSHLNRFVRRKEIRICKSGERTDTPFHIHRVCQAKYTRLYLQQTFKSRQKRIQLEV